MAFYIPCDLLSESGFMIIFRTDLAIFAIL